MPLLNLIAKGDILLQAARSGQSVTRAGSILIMFGGEDSKGHKMNDLHILDLKSLMWLPLHTTSVHQLPPCCFHPSAFSYLEILSSGSHQTLKNGFYTGIVGLD